MKPAFNPTYDIGEEYVAPIGGYYPHHPDWHCACSCGAESAVTFSDRRGHYVAKQKGWTYDPKTGWTCGGEGHTRGNNVVTSGHQAGYVASVRSVITGGLDDGDDEE